MKLYELNYRSALTGGNDQSLNSKKQNTLCNFLCLLDLSFFDLTAQHIYVNYFLISMFSVEHFIITLYYELSECTCCSTVCPTKP